MKIVTVHFDREGSADYKLLLDVYRESIRRNLKGVELVEIEIPFPEDLSGRGLFCHFNHAKLIEWAKYLESTDDETIFTDCDMLALHSPRQVFRDDFDVGYTVRTSEGGNYPINGGVVLAKPTEAARQFFNFWVMVDDWMLTDELFHSFWVKKYSGLNQSSFGCLLEGAYRFPSYKKLDAKLKEYKTRPFNCVECDWRNVDGSEYFIHIKTRLRRDCLAAARGQIYKVPARIEKPLALWLDVYRNKGGK